MLKQKTILGTIALVISMILTSAAYSASPKVGFISSEDLRSNFPEAQQADARIQSLVEEWKRELENLKRRIEDLEFDIKKNRLIWSDEERSTKQQRLEDLKREHVTYAKDKFEAGGQYDKVVQTIMEKVEEKIYAAVQEVAAEEGYDIIWDKSIQPLPYVNYKYDLTVKVLRKLGVDVKKLEEELNAKISKDPRNKKKSSKEAPKRSRSRRRRTRQAKPEKEVVKEASTESSSETKKEEPIKPETSEKEIVK